MSLLDPNAGNPNYLKLIAIRPEKLEEIRKEFDLDAFDATQPHAIVELNAGNFLFLNVREFPPSARQAITMMRLHDLIRDFGRLRQVEKGSRSSPAHLLKIVGHSVTWRPWEGQEPIKMHTCFNATAAQQFHSPPPV